MFKSTEPLSFDSPAENGIVRRFSTSTKVFMLTPTRNRTPDLPHARCCFSVAELLEGAVAAWEGSGSSPGLDGHKNICGRKKPFDYVSFRRAVKR